MVHCIWIVSISIEICVPERCRATSARDLQRANANIASCAGSTGHGWSDDACLVDAKSQLSTSNITSAKSTARVIPLISIPTSLPTSRDQHPRLVIRFGTYTIVWHRCRADETVNVIMCVCQLSEAIVTSRETEPSIMQFLSLRFVSAVHPRHQTTATKHCWIRGTPTSSYLIIMFSTPSIL